MKRPGSLPLWCRHAGLCFWCGAATRLHGGNLPDTASREHVYSRFNWKRWHPDLQHLPHLLLACRGCNSARGEYERQNRRRAFPRSTRCPVLVMLRRPQTKAAA